jgi:hypothetical protein
MPQDATPLVIVCVVGMLLFVIGVLAFTRIIATVNQMIHRMRNQAQARSNYENKEDAP